jgi:hypothetical protein
MSELKHCPNGNAFNPSCKKRTCPFCGPRWAQRWRRVMFTNLEAYDGPVIMVAITAPGADRLPWDETHCHHPNGGQHGGKRGCRVQQRAAREWSETASTRYGMLRQTAAQHTRRHAPAPVNLLERVWEPQRRGVPHLHLVLGAGSREEIEAAAEFVSKLKDSAVDYDFGHVDARGKKGSKGGRVVARGQILKLVSAQDAARYLSAYLTGRSKHKPSIRETVNDPALSFLHGKEKRQALPLIWLTPRLTRITKVTMRNLRRAGHLIAASKGWCDFPKWRDIYEAIDIGAAYRRAFARRGEGGEGPPVDERVGQMLDYADGCMARIALLPETGPNWHYRFRQEEELLAVCDQVALFVAGLTRHENAPALAVAA